MAPDYPAHLFDKFVEISDRQAAALQSLAEQARRDDSQLASMARNQEEITHTQERMGTLIERILTRLDQSDSQAAERTRSAVDQVRVQIEAEASELRLDTARDARWTKILCGLLALVGMLISGLIALRLGR